MTSTVMSQTSTNNLASLEKGCVSRANRTARRVVLACFLATAMLVSALFIERNNFQQSSAKAIDDVKSAILAESAIVLEDEILTMSANLAASSGEVRWPRRYEEHLAKMDSAIAQATVLASPESARRFDAATRVANDALVEMEKSALLKVKQGDLLAAQAILNGMKYQEQKDVLAKGSAVFFSELQAGVDQHLQDLTRRSVSLFIGMIAVSCVAFALLWRYLLKDLQAAQEVFEKQQEEVTRLALHDPLTGLANRRYLKFQTDSAVARINQDKSSFAVIALDLDGFKPVNDRLGHAAGDQVLTEIGRRLTTFVRKDEFVARLGGDEFVLLINAVPGRREVEAIARRLIRVLSKPIDLGGDTKQMVTVGSSAGVAFYPQDAQTIDELFRRADLALYLAKSEGRGQVRFFQQVPEQTKPVLSAEGESKSFA